MRRMGINISRRASGGGDDAVKQGQNNNIAVYRAASNNLLRCVIKTLDLKFIEKRCKCGTTAPAAAPVE